jgi:hypothetical protein
MKKALYLLCCSLWWASGPSDAIAQSNGSRLNMAGKSKTAVLPPKSPLSFSPYKVNNQPLILEKSKAVSTYYRTLIFGSDSGVVAAEEDKEIEVKQGIVPPAATSRAISFESNSKRETENLYINDQITVKNLYPNPANDYAYLQYLIGQEVKDVKVSLYNVLGATVKEYLLNRQSQLLTVDTRSLPNGVYFYQLTVDGQKVATKKLLVRHH